MSAAAEGSPAPGGVLFFGAYDPEYPRNAVLRKGLARCGVPVDECRVDGRLKVHLRYPALLARYLGRRRTERVLFVPDFRHKDVPLAWALARCGGRALIFDPLVSRYETRVLDRGDAARKSAQAWHNRNIDAISMRLPDLVLADTGAHAAFYAQEFSIPSDKLRSLPVGFDDEVFAAAPPRPPGGPAVVLFYGSFLPLHGVETIVEAARILACSPIRFEFVGAGQTRETAERLAAGLPKGKAIFRPPVPQRELPGIIAAADIVLGVFGVTPKTAMVVPNKVYQALAVGRSVVTAASPAVREFFSEGIHLFTVPPGDARALAAAIERLAGDAALRESLAGAGGAHVRAEYGPGRIGERCVALLKEAGAL